MIENRKMNKVVVIKDSQIAFLCIIHIIAQAEVTVRSLAWPLIVKPISDRKKRINHSTKYIKTILKYSQNTRRSLAQQIRKAPNKKNALQQERGRAPLCSWHFFFIQCVTPPFWILLAHRRSAETKHAEFTWNDFFISGGPTHAHYPKSAFPILTECV